MFDNIDPDFFSMLELAEMGNKVPLEGEYYQYMWLRTGRNFSDGLRPLEGEADILSLVEEMQAEAAKFVRVFVKQLTLVQARNRMVEVYRELCKNGRPPAGGVILEELDVGDREESQSAMNAHPSTLAIEWVVGSGNDVQSDQQSMAGREEEVAAGGDELPVGGDDAAVRGVDQIVTSDDVAGLDEGVAVGGENMAADEDELPTRLDDGAGREEETPLNEEVVVSEDDMPQQRREGKEQLSDTQMSDNYSSSEFDDSSDEDFSAGSKGNGGGEEYYSEYSNDDDGDSVGLMNDIDKDIDQDID
ncbi:hypothetical protein LINGRAHAP2_LOCUS15082 [Linum grandiflorum]